MTRSPLRPPALSASWRSALVGALAALPVAAVLNCLPDSDATIGGAVTVIGAFVAGVVAALRSTDPDAAGLRAGFLGGVLAVLTLVVTAVSAAVSGTGGAWPPSRIAFWAFAVGVVLCLAPVFGLVFGRVGGWAAGAVASRLATGARRP